MSNNFSQTVELLFENENITNFKLFPGSQREVDMNDVINEINSALTQINMGEAEEISFN